MARSRVVLGYPPLEPKESYAYLLKSLGTVGCGQKVFGALATERTHLRAVSNSAFFPIALSSGLGLCTPKRINHALKLQGMLRYLAILKPVIASIPFENGGFLRAIV